MSGFFDRFEQQHQAAQGAELEVEEEFEQPEWGGHPHTVVPGRSNQVVTLFRTEVATLVLCCIDAYPIGIEFSLRLLTAKSERRSFSTPLDLSCGGGNQSEQSVRFGVEFSDGRSWSSLSQPPTFPITSDRDDIVVINQGGGGGGRFWELRFWLWPLPPDGPLTFYADWPAHGVTETSTVIDATELRSLAQSAVKMDLHRAPPLSSRPSAALLLSFGVEARRRRV